MVVRGCKSGTPRSRAVCLSTPGSMAGPTGVPPSLRLSPNLPVSSLAAILEEHSSPPIDNHYPPPSSRTLPFCQIHSTPVAALIFESYVTPLIDVFNFLKWCY